jgi:hypothetical protein
MLHGRERVFVEDNCCVEDKNKECMHLRTCHPH